MANSIGSRTGRSFAREARAAASEGRTEDAIVLFEKAIALSPSFPNWHRDLSMCYAKVNRWKRASASLLTALKVAGDRFSDWPLLLATLYKRQDWQALREVAKRARQKSPDSPEPYYYLGAAKLGLGQRQKAKATLLHGLSLDQTANDLDYKLLAVSAERFPDRRRMLHFVNQNLESIKKEAAEFVVRSTAHQRKIFLYWGQGFDVAHPLVELCQRQMVRVHGEENIVLLDDRVIGQYLELPEYVNNNPGIGRAHRSDVIRIMLLARYGGIWADATCLAVADLRHAFERYLEKGFFAYRRSPLRIANWFLCSSPGSTVARMMACALLMHWKTKRATTDYFIFQHLFEALAIADKDFAMEWGETESRNRAPCLELARSLHEEYVAGKFNRTLTSAPIHKLTYKEHKYRSKVTAIAEYSNLNHIMKSWA